MDIFEKKNFIVERIKRFSADRINPNDVILCNTDRELLDLILKQSPNYWFNNYVLTLDEFIQFFEEYFEEYNIFTTGEHHLYGNHTAYAFGDAILYVYNDYKLHAYQKAVVYAYTQSHIFTHDFVKAEAHNLSCIDMFDINCKTKYFDESGGNIYNGEAKSYDKSNVTLFEGTLTSNNYSHVKTLAGGYKKITALDNCRLELHGSPCADCYNSCNVRAFDFSEVTCHNNVCVECYNKSQVILNDLTACIAHDTSTVHICAAKCVKLMDLSVGYNYHDIAIKMDVSGTSYLCDLTDTFTQVQNNGTIKWTESGKVFSNQRNLN